MPCNSAGSLPCLFSSMTLWGVARYITDGSDVLGALFDAPDDALTSSSALAARRCTYLCALAQTLVISDPFLMQQIVEAERNVAIDKPVGLAASAKRVRTLLGRSMGQGS